MKHLQVNFIAPDKLINGITGLPAIMDLLPKHPLDNLLWSNNEYKPEVTFTIAYTDDSILLKYFVKETYFKADYHQIYDPVFKDSCVEFFIAFGDDANYYNLEFNSVGTAQVGYGLSKDRQYLDNALISKIKNHHTIKIQQGYTQWELTLDIPFLLFTHHQISSLTNIQCRANFYKCGDDLPEPHFMSWSPVSNPIPNFHLPQFFGTIQFV